MTPTSRPSKIFLSVGCLLLLFLSAAAVQAACPNPTPSAGNDTFHMLVLGDSIMWGQGLRDDEKFSTRTKCWLQEKTHREVRVHVEAHSGAVVDGAGPTLSQFATSDGEVNLTTPTINEELDHAITFYKSVQATPALTLVDGCINDVGVKTLLTVSTPLEYLRARVKKSCGDDMLQLLLRARSSFPDSVILVTNYYPIVSAQTDDNAFLRLLVKKLNSQSAQQMSDKEMRQRLIAISDEWYRTSTASLADAVAKANGTGELSPKIVFAEIEFGPEHVFAAPESLLWNFRFAATNATGVARVIVALSFGSAAYKPNDHVRESRVKSCEETFKKPKGVKEDKNQKRNREDLFLICRYASLGHPNNMGALVYAEAIKGRLLPLIEKAGWKRDTNSQLTQQ